MEQNEKNTREFFNEVEEKQKRDKPLIVKKSDYGITLIALVVTIIVLLILARSVY